MSTAKVAKVAKVAKPVGFGFVPFMLTDDDLLHDPGDMHDPLARDCGPLEVFSRAFASPDEARDGSSRRVDENVESDATRPRARPRARRENERSGVGDTAVASKRFYWNVERSCVAAGCSETTNLKARNDRRYPLCERHKRTPAVTCANGDVVCFCFYCYRAHGTDAFTTNTHTCDVQYYKRRRRRLETLSRIDHRAWLTGGGG